MLLFAMTSHGFSAPTPRARRPQLRGPATDTFPERAAAAEVEQYEEPPLLTWGGFEGSSDGFPSLVTLRASYGALAELP